jgi:hypothetical protein
MPAKAAGDRRKWPGPTSSRRSAAAASPEQRPRQAQGAVDRDVQPDHPPGAQHIEQPVGIAGQKPWAHGFVGCRRALIFLGWLPYPALTAGIAAVTILWKVSDEGLDLPRPQRCMLVACAHQ